MKMKRLKNEEGFIKLAVLIIILVAAFLLIKQLSSTRSSFISDTGANLPLEEKTKRAELYLEEHRKNINSFFSEVEGKNIPPQQLQSHFNKFNKVAQQYADRINALRLVCPDYAKSTADPKYKEYISWTEDFRKRESQLMEETNQRIQEIVNKANARG